MIPEAMAFSVKQVDYLDPQDAADFVRLLREYARFENCDRPELEGLPGMLAGLGNAFSVLAFADADAFADQWRPVGLINCFVGFSTFQLRPVVNIHDVIVTREFRGRGIAGVMLQAVERIARDQGCCRLTLEVYDDNHPARRAYEKYGFTRDPAHPEVDVHFLRKSL